MRKVCNSQLATLALDMRHSEASNSTHKGVTRSANDFRWGKYDHVPTFALSESKPSAFEPLLVGIG